MKFCDAIIMIVVPLCSKRNCGTTTACFFEKPAALLQAAASSSWKETFVSPSSRAEWNHNHGAVGKNMSQVLLPNLWFLSGLQAWMCEHDEWLRGDASFQEILHLPACIKYTEIQHAIWIVEMRWSIQSATASGDWLMVNPSFISWSGYQKKPCVWTSSERDSAW